MNYHEQARALRQSLTLREKLEQINGTDYMFIRPLWDKGLRAIHFSDASLGLRDYRQKYPSTVFPSTIGLAATFNRDLAARQGEVLGAEFAAAGVDVLLGPGVNMARVPTCGRNSEYMGEDPYLAAGMVVPFIQGVQSKGVAATVKHLACNNTDWHRKASNSVVDERTLREIYLPAFEAAVKQGGVKAVMTAYNLLNGLYCGEHRWLISELLQKEWGFSGLVMSDWDAIYNAQRAIGGGLHIEMPGQKIFYPPAVKALLDDGLVKEADIDAMVDAILAFMLECVAERESKAGLAKGRCAEHVQTSVDVEREAAVLLKNDGPLLPLSKTAAIGLLGPFVKKAPTSAGGSAMAQAVAPLGLLDAIKAVAPQARLVLDEGKIDTCDVVLACVGLGHEIEAEAGDRAYGLPKDQEDLLKRVRDSKKPFGVVLFAGAGVDMEAWADPAQALLMAWYPGERGTQALAEILFGDTNPSGKLPITLERRFEDVAAATHYLPAGAELHPPTDYHQNLAPRYDVVYAEGVFTGYRHFDQAGIAPRFAFGHGLSYTSFTYADLRIEDRRVTCSVTNSGSRAGAEAVQLYVAPPAGQRVPRPPKELKGFGKLSLGPGESQDISFTLEDRSFAYFDVTTKAWAAEKGSYGILIGASSRDIRLEGKVVLGSAH